MNKKLLIILSAIVFLLGGCTKGNKVERTLEKPEDAKVNINEKVSIEIDDTDKTDGLGYKLEIDTVKKDGTNYKIDLKIPIIKGEKAAAFEDINSKVKNKINQSSDMLDNLINEMSEDELKEFTGNRKLYVGSEFNAVFQDDNYLSIKGFLFQYTGGAHGGSIFDNYTYDLNEAKLLDLSDLFKEDYEYIALIVSTIEREIEKEPEAYYEDHSRLDELAREAKFYISKEGLVICLDTYSIAPYSSGPQEFLIKSETLKDSVKAKYESIWE